MERALPLDPVLWHGVGLSVGPLLLLTPWPAGLALAAAAGIAVLRPCSRRGVKRPLAWRGVVMSAVLGLVALGALRGRDAIEQQTRARASILALVPWPARCEVSGTIVRSPVFLGGRLVVELGEASLRCEDGLALAVSSGVRLHAEPASERPLARGDQVRAIASVAPPYRFVNPGTPDPRPIEARRRVVLSGGADDLVRVTEGRGVHAVIDRIRDRLRWRIAAAFSPATSGMARALVLGEDDLTEEDQVAFRRSGLAHLLAVSGMHLVLVVFGIVGIVRALLVRIPSLAGRFDVGRFAAALGLPVAWGYVELAGGSGSARRAAWMCSAVLLARMLDRRASPFRALGLSWIIMGAVDPLVVFDLSFLLSALATLGLLLLARPLADGVRRRWPRLPGFVVTPLAATTSATVACSPVLLRIAPELPAGSLLANVVAVPFGELCALPLCLLHALLALTPWPAAANGAAIVAAGPLVVVRAIARAFAGMGIPLAPPTPPELAVLAVLAVALVAGYRWRMLALAGLAIGLLEIAVRRAECPSNVLRATFLDVGQGDATLLDLPDGSAILVDGGGLVGSPIDVGERVVGAVLEARRRRTLRAVVLSHPHPDHYLGLRGALGHVRPSALWDTGQGEREGVGGAYAALLADVRRQSIPVVRPPDLCGRRTVGGVVLEVLAPCPDAAPDRGPNDNSFVLRVTYGSRSLLLVGDAEREAEASLLAQANESRRTLQADVLKVGHHGSRTSSSPELIGAVRPEVAVISVGVRNRFGHPRPETLATLAQAGVRVFRTDRDGAVTITTDGRELRVEAEARTSLFGERGAP